VVVVKTEENMLQFYKQIILVTFAMACVMPGVPADASQFSESPEMSRRRKEVAPLCEGISSQIKAQPDYPKFLRLLLSNPDEQINALFFVKVQQDGKISGIRFDSDLPKEILKQGTALILSVDPLKEVSSKLLSTDEIMIRFQRTKSEIEAIVQLYPIRLINARIGEQSQWPRDPPRVDE
jgi:hypothetical protein